MAIDVKGYRLTHISPGRDKNHQVQVWQNSNNRYFIPAWSRDGRSFNPYKSGGKQVAFMSYGTAMKHMYGGGQS